VIKTPVTAKEVSATNNKEAKPVKEKKIIEKTEAVDKQSVNPDLLSDAEKLAMLDKLTDKEREVFLLAAEGKKNGEIASILNSSESSVKVHRSRMTGKLGMKKPEELKKLISGSKVSASKANLEETPDLAINEAELEVKKESADNENPDLFTKS
jgi:DNA-binding NarL/FixJ family response regulator